MKIFTKIFLVLVVGMLSLALVAPAVAQEKMTMDEYKAELAAAQQREATAKAEIAKVDEEITRLQAEIASTDQQISSAWDEIYAMVGTDRAGVEAYRNQIRSLEGDVDALMALSPEELYKRRAEIDQLQARLDEIKGSKISKLTEMQDWIAMIEGKQTQLRSKVASYQPSYDQYTVVRGDYLWRISGKQEIYGDPYQWMRIFSFNREMIKDANLIYPDQNFKIHRGEGSDEFYVVKKGDYLAKIAGSAMGGPTTWMKVYEANKDIIGDNRNLIYPYTVLRVPK